MRNSINITTAALALSFASCTSTPDVSEADKPGADGKTVLDFNKATSPPCAFVPYATCPLPPKQNFLSIEVPAGLRGRALESKSLDKSQILAYY